MAKGKPEDQFIDYAKEEEFGPMHGEAFNTMSPSGPSTKFLQNSLNEYDKVMARMEGREPDQLDVDGKWGEKTKAKAKDMLKTLPPEMKRFANARIKKSLNGGPSLQMPPGINEEQASEVLANVDFENLDLDKLG